MKIEILNTEMTIEKIVFEKLKDDSKIITVYGVNIHGQRFIDQEVIKSPVIFEALQKKLEGKDEN